jgi:hypothetical protein
MSTAVEILRANPEEAALLARVDSLLDSYRANRESLHRNYVEVSLAMVEVKKTRAWLARAHSWDQYVKDCGERLGKKRTVLYAGVSVIERLSPYVETKQLVEMGISKSQPLAQYVKQKGTKPPDNLMSKALDPSVSAEQFRADIARETHQPVDEKSKWRTIGFFCTDDEWAEIERAFALARREGQIDENLPENLVQFRTISAMAKECIGSWEAK